MDDRNIVMEVLDQMVAMERKYRDREIQEVLSIGFSEHKIGLIPHILLISTGRK